MITIVAGTIVTLGLAAVIIFTTARVLTTMTGAPRSEPHATSFALLPVLEMSSIPCAAGTVGALDGTSCYKLGQGMTGIRAEKATAGLSGGTTWVVQVTLNNSDSAKFAALTSALYQLPAPRNQLAIVIDGKAITAPTITQPISGPELEISGAFTRKDATDLARRLAGGPN
ncbi:SecDF P1 head subdomain-containing protein [Nonomuraea sp. CA-143628]|uniref:SecDF P1 head subdomain-containing protein n=1 Tax=Nonomuraea sp. CA-143628 TaxID=3239997 RepID=UPI003D8CF3A5